MPIPNWLKTPVRWKLLEPSDVYDRHTVVLIRDHHTMSHLRVCLSAVALLGLVSVGTAFAQTLTPGPSPTTLAPAAEPFHDEQGREMIDEGVQLREVEMGQGEDQMGRLPAGGRPTRSLQAARVGHSSTVA